MNEARTKSASHLLTRSFVRYFNLCGLIDFFCREQGVVWLCSMAPDAMTDIDTAATAKLLGASKITLATQKWEREAISEWIAFALRQKRQSRPGTSRTPFGYARAT